MKYRVVPTVAALEDITEIACYLRERSQTVAAKFLQLLDATYEQLAGMPELGTKKYFAHPEMQNVRIWPVKKYRNYLLFYRIEEDRILVLRVLHGARDYEGLFGGETDI